MQKYFVLLTYNRNNNTKDKKNLRVPVCHLLEAALHVVLGEVGVRPEGVRYGHTGAGSLGQHPPPAGLCPSAAGCGGGTAAATPTPPPPPLPAGVHCCTAPHGKRV